MEIEGKMEKREAAIKSHLLKLFVNDINNARYIELSKLYEAAHITNSMLIEQLNRHTAALTDFYNSVYVDIACIRKEPCILQEQGKPLICEKIRYTRQPETRKRMRHVF